MSPRYATHVTTGTTAATLTHGRRRARRLEGAVLVVFCLACAVAFLAGALGLALLILVVIA